MLCEVVSQSSFRIDLAFLIVASIAGLVSPSALAQSPKTEKELTYWQDIQPILRKNCAYCHAQRHVKKQDVSGGLALDSYEAILKGGKHPVLKVGNSKASLLVDLMVTADKKKRMPLDGDPMPTEQIDLIRRWIDSGAREGKKPDDAPTTITTAPVKVRKLNVSLLTQATPPAGVLGKAAPGPLTLNLKIGPLAPVTAVAFSPDGDLLATAVYGQVTVWDLKTVRPVRVLTNVLGAVNDLAFSPDGKKLVVAGGQPSAKGELRIFQVADWKQLGAYREHHDVVFSVAFSADGKRLAAASFDQTVSLWDMDGHKHLKDFAAHSDFVYAVAFRPDGKAIASASKDRSVRLTDIATGKALFTMGGMEQDVMAVAFSKDGKQVISSGFETALYWWNAETGEQIKKQGGHGVAVHELALSKDGQWLVSAGADRTARIWDGKAGTPIKSITVGSPVYAVALSPDKKWLATGSFDGQVRLWDATSSKQLLALVALPAQDDQADWLALTPNGYLASSDGLAKSGTWTMKGGPVSTTDAVWQALRQPQLLPQALAGKALPAPKFSK
jgi:DNA-binding beta-propeller fold protein YncE